MGRNSRNLDRNDRVYRCSQWSACIDRLGAMIVYAYESGSRDRRIHGGQILYWFPYVYIAGQMGLQTKNLAVQIF